jgi:hypothetical protein
VLLSPLVFTSKALTPVPAFEQPLVLIYPGRVKQDWKDLFLPVHLLFANRG